MSKTKGQIQVTFLRGVLSRATILQANFSMHRGFLRSSDPKFYLTLDQGGVRTLHEFSWTPELEQFLLTEQRCRTETPEEESERFATILSNNLLSVEQQYGRDYARAVFTEILRRRHAQQLGDLLARVPEPRPNRESTAYHDCAHFLEHSIDGLQNTAMIELGYPSDVAAHLVLNALRIVLDETYLLSSAELFSRR